MSWGILKTAVHRIRKLLAPTRTKGRISSCTFLALCGLCGTTAYAGGGGQDQVARGRQLARIECSQCHVVDQDLPPSLQVSAPSFEAIANGRTINEKSLRHFISTTHWDGQTMPMTMPALGLTKQQTIAVVAYIVSLRKASPPKPNPGRQ